MIDDFSDYEKLYINACIFAKIIIKNQDCVEDKEKEKEFDDLFILDFDDVVSISVLLIKKILTNDCIYKTNRFCVLYVCLNICTKTFFYCF